MISFNCPKETAKQRFLSRKLPDRLHDDDVMFEKRFAEFEREEGEIVQYYRSQGKLEEVNGPSFCHSYMSIQLTDISYVHVHVHSWIRAPRPR